MSEHSTAGVNATREASFLLANVEKCVLVAIAARLPRWVLPDGLLAAFGITIAYGLSNHSSAWLWLASALLVVQWLGDSLDGTLARVRQIQRPRYGYYLDHIAVATAAIGIGLGLSPVSSGLARDAGGCRGSSDAPGPLAPGRPLFEMARGSVSVFGTITRGAGRELMRLRRAYRWARAHSTGELHRG